MAAGRLTFQRASTSSASSRKPPNVLPIIIQMGMWDSSTLEISNAIYKGKKNSEMSHGTLPVSTVLEGAGGQIGFAGSSI